MPFTSENEVKLHIGLQQRRGAHCPAHCRSYVVEKLTVGKWIFLWVVLAEGVSLGLAMVMRSMGELHGRSAAPEL